MLDTTVNNFEVTYNHLWERSRSTLVEMERVIKRKKLKVIISTEIEALVVSFSGGRDMLDSDCCDHSVMYVN